MSSCLSVAMLASCAWIDKVDPPLVQTSTKDYPCGKQGVVCEDQGDAGLAATGMCCDQGEVCGGGWPNVGCPAGQCCWEGDNGFGARPNRPQHPAHTTP